MIALHRVFASIDGWLHGWPDMALTIALLALAGLLVLIALRGSPALKAIVVGWVVFP